MKTIEELEAELETVRRELATVTILEDGREIVSVANLLAVIHGDGGHYALAHGWGRAILDAEAVVVALRRERDWFIARCGELQVKLNQSIEAEETVKRERDEARAETRLIDESLQKLLKEYAKVSDERDFERQNWRDEQERADRILRELRQLERAVPFDPDPLRRMKNGWAR